LEGFEEVEALFAKARAEQAPGRLFFEGLREDVMAGLEAAPSEPSWEGRKVEGAQAQPEGLGAWSRLRAWWGQSPTRAWALVMAAALLGVIVWPSQEPAPSQEPTPSPWAQAPAQEPAPSKAQGEVRALVPHSLDAGELAALRELAGRLRVDLGDERAGGWAEAEASPLEADPTEPGGASPEALEDMEAVWERSL
jgi:hypothetical protein